MSSKRIRSVYQDLFSDHAFTSVSLPARLLWIGILTQCDDQGVFAWRPRQLRARILPVEPELDIDALLDELLGADMIRRFDAEDLPFGAVRNFRVYQKPRREYHADRLPESLQNYVFGNPSLNGTKSTSLNSTKRPPLNGTKSTSLNRVRARADPAHARARAAGTTTSTCTRIPDTVSTDSPKKESVQKNTHNVRARTREETSHRTTRRAVRKISDEAFEAIKSAYPKREGSQPWARARQSINARCNAGAKPKDLLDATKRYADYCQAKGWTATTFVMQAVRFFGPNLEYEADWKLAEHNPDNPSVSEATQKMRDAHFGGLSPHDFFNLSPAQQAEARSRARGGEPD
ncbi:hypothetical protein [Candidatus Poriferisocius sp.]|uniref:hypothetical protein n=1 Tax=Candidatus Poriferisocius sp. TaxID=3101276 RepID=UPI003B01BAC0